MGLKYKIIPLSQPIHLLPVFETGRKAFINDALQAALFPPRLSHPNAEEEMKAFRLKRTKDRLTTKGAHNLVAVLDDENPSAPPVDGEEEGDGKGQRVLGLSGWVEPNLDQTRIAMGLPPEDGGLNGEGGQNRDEEQKKEGDDEGTIDDGHGGKRGDGKKLPLALDADVYFKVMKAMEQAKKELLGDEANKVWYLASLGVDPDYAGHGIASKLVQWGIDRAEETGYSVYTESRPAAVGVYKRLGFVELKRLRLLGEDNDDEFTLMIKRPKKGKQEPGPE